jgi:hypothetical protein
MNFSVPSSGNVNITMGTGSSFSTIEHNLTTDDLLITNNRGASDSDIAFITNAAERVRITGGGNVGIGTVAPNNTLHVFGTINASQIRVNNTAVMTINQWNATNTTYLRNNGDTATGNYTFDTNTLFIDSTNHRVGIGTTTPSHSLQVAGSLNISGTNGSISTSSGSNQILLSNSVSNFLTSTGSLELQSNGGTTQIKLDSGSLTVGIGTTTPKGGKLNIVGGNLNMSNNNITDVTKITLATGGAIDPPYKIGNTTYATYVASITGIKEETSGTIVLSEEESNLASSSAHPEATGNANDKTNSVDKRSGLIKALGLIFGIGKPVAPTSNLNALNASSSETTTSYAYTIDFSKLEKSSDLWLFYQITDFGDKWEKLQVILSPGFDGRAWYTKDPVAKTLTIHGTPAKGANVEASPFSGEVSYRMTANRYDSENWPTKTDMNISGPGLQEKK